MIFGITFIKSAFTCTTDPRLAGRLGRISESWLLWSRWLEWGVRSRMCCSRKPGGTHTKKTEKVAAAFCTKDKNAKVKVEYKHSQLVNWVLTPCYSTAQDHIRAKIDDSRATTLDKKFKKAAYIEPLSRLAWMCDECTWHHKTFPVQLYWHLEIKLCCIVSFILGIIHIRTADTRDVLTGL